MERAQLDAILGALDGADRTLVRARLGDEDTPPRSLRAISRDTGHSVGQISDALERIIVQLIHTERVGSSALAVELLEHERDGDTLREPTAGCAAAEIGLARGRRTSAR